MTRTHDPEADLCRVVLMSLTALAWLLATAAMAGQLWEVVR